MRGVGRDERWFRRVFETAADQGAEAPASQEGVDDRYDWGEGADPEMVRRFPKGPQQMWESQRNADSTITRLTQAQQEAAAERERAVAEAAKAEQAALANRDPLREDLHQVIPDDLARNLSQRFERDPQGAYELAVEAERLYGPDLKNRVMAAWSQVDYTAAMTYFVKNLVDPVFDERFQSYEDRLNDRLGPTLAHATTQISDAAVASAMRQAPDLGQYEDRIGQMINEEQGGNPALISDCVGDAEKMAARLVFFRDSLWAQDERLKQQQAGQAPTATAEDAPKARPRQATIASGSAPRPLGDADDYAKQLKESMKGVKARVIN